MALRMNGYTGRLRAFINGQWYSSQPQVAFAISLTEDYAAALAASGAEIPSAVQGDRGLIDTGSTQTYVKTSLIRELGVPKVDERPVNAPLMTGPSSVTLAIVYRVSFILAGGVHEIDVLSGGPDDSGKRVAGRIDKEPYNAVIGQDLLQYYIMYWNGPAGSFGIEDGGSSSA